MIYQDLIEKNKNKILNFGVIILALVVALLLYKNNNEQVSVLIQQQNNELEKNKVVEEIAALEKKTDIYKKVFVKKDLALIMDTISGIAKSTSVKIISAQSSSEEAMNNYFNVSFSIALSAPNYHALGNFISKIENHNDIYLVSEIRITPVDSNRNVNVNVANSGLEVSLKIDTLSYL